MRIEHDIVRRGPISYRSESDEHNLLEESDVGESVSSPIYCSKDCIYVTRLKQWRVAGATLPQEVTVL